MFSSVDYQSVISEQNNKTRRFFSKYTKNGGDTGRQDTPLIPQANEC